MYGAGAGLLYAAVSNQTDFSLFGQGQSSGQAPYASSTAVPFTLREWTTELQKPNNQQTKYTGHEWLTWTNNNIFVAHNHGGQGVTTAVYLTKKLESGPRGLQNTTSWSTEKAQIMADQAWLTAFSQEYTSGNFRVWADGYGQHVANQTEAKLIALSQPKAAQLLTAGEYRNQVLVPLETYFHSTFSGTLHTALKVPKQKTKPSPASSLSYPTY